MRQVPIKRFLDRVPGGPANHAFQPAAAKATVLVAASVVVTAICVPFVTAWWAHRAPGTAMAAHERESPEALEHASAGDYASGSNGREDGKRERVELRGSEREGSGHETA